MSKLSMRLRILLPILGIILFGCISYFSIRVRQKEFHFSKYLFWANIRLDSDPLNRLSSSSSECKNNANNRNLICRDTEYVIVHPSPIEKFFMISTLPAFLLGLLAVLELARFGINEVVSFLSLMPVLIAAWYYLVGWILDHWIQKRFRRMSSEVA